MRSIAQDRQMSTPTNCLCPGGPQHNGIKLSSAQHWMINWQQIYRCWHGRSVVSLTLSAQTVQEFSRTGIWRSRANFTGLHHTTVTEHRSSAPFKHCLKSYTFRSVDCLCVCVCLCVNQGGTNHDRYTRRLVILHVIHLENPPHPAMSPRRPLTSRHSTENYPPGDFPRTFSLAENAHSKHSLRMSQLSITADEMLVNIHVSILKIPVYIVH